ncbi:hypothetical protein HI113_29475 [Corallococcus exiguus]|uniref:hypothetical protein n=1 Tax=Corallococcus exiguus TaxID=83462 RepID=UPI001474AB05|nr:hypothetical protein [Corallococcus exiguus]
MLARGWWVFLLVLLSGCSGVRPVVTLDMGAGRKATFVPRQDVRVVELDEAGASLKDSARRVRPSSRPQQAARELFQMEARSGAYRFEPRERRITPLGAGEQLEVLDSGSVGGLTREYLRWCERTQRQGDCLRLLAETPILDGDGSFGGFKQAMGPAGAGKQWHHIVEQTPGNVERFGPQALHNTDNVIRLDARMHARISGIFSAIRRDLTRSSTITVRQWLSTQSFEEQRRFGLLVLEQVSKGAW